jgi:glycosyltransferase involved in cell wall biosynthesis
MGMPASDSWGGPASSEPPFVEALRRLGHDVVEEDYVYGDKERPTPFFARVSRVVGTALRLRRRIKSESFDIVHLNSAFDKRTILRDSFTVFLMGKRRPKVFIKLHGSLPEQFHKPGPVFGPLIGYVKRHVDGFGYFTTDEVELFEEIGFDRRRFHRIGNAISAHLSLPAGFHPPQKSPDEIFELLFVARFVTMKGLTMLIDACAILRHRGVRFRLTCVGDGEARRDAEDAVGRHGLGRVVTFTGHIPEEQVQEQMMAADIFVFPTLYGEGFPMAMFTAMALGLPVVTTQIRILRDRLSEPDNCLVAERSAESLAGRIEELIADKELRERMSANNLEYGRSLGPDEIAKEFEAVYTKVIGRDTKK